MQKIEEIIKKAREAKGLTQTKVAEMVSNILKQSYSLRQYQRFEAGDFPKFKREVVSAIEKILEIPIHDKIYELNSHVEEVEFPYLHISNPESITMEMLLQVNAKCDVILSSLAELLAAQKGGTVAKIINDQETLVREQLKEKARKLRRS